MPPPVRAVLYTLPTGRPMHPQREDDGPFLADRLQDGDDPLQRLSRLVDKIKEANNLLNQHFSGDPTGTLKLFMAPEWFFRKEKSPYTLAETKSLLNQLIVESGKPPLDSWLIVPGTIYWGEKISGNKWRVFNAAIATGNGKLLSLIHKQHEADIAKERAKFEQWGTENDLGKAIQASVKILQELGVDTNSVDIQGLFDYRDVSFALEVCADHGPAVKRLKSQVEERVRPKLPEGSVLQLFDSRFVDIHLLISNSATQTPLSVIARSGGYFIQCEGAYADPAKNLQGSAKVIRIPGLKEHRAGSGDQLTVLPQSLTSRINKTVFPANSEDPFERLFVFDELLKLDKSKVTDSISALVSN